VISLLLYIIVSYLIVPLWRRHRARYSNYLPLDRISTHTTSARQRFQTALAGAAARLLLPSHWRREYAREQAAGAGVGDFDEEDGEELYTVEDIESNRREALSLDVHRDDGGRRLSRELEEGFKDDSDQSDDDESDIHGGRSQRILR
jgi:hypothetical protein